MLDDETEEHVKRLATCISDHKGENVLCIDVSELSSWTDCFIIATVPSLGHMRGLVRERRNLWRELDLEINHKHKKISEDGWELVDCGSVVIHLMTEQMRSFYELEKLWHAGRLIEIA